MNSWFVNAKQMVSMTSKLSAKEGNGRTIFEVLKYSSFNLVIEVLLSINYRS